ncbi:hypothetical protein TNCV_4373821 [Trichonephila clavipes]|uniref:Uncharacterized protein n=1 Tax=Trichonephila clavipes TaxID=2585209 RepID=A0A8X6UXP4_TRICX|nr:hypothetical protein TNCV_4373821 [Trichonephila clavipes]
MQKDVERERQSFVGETANVALRRSRLQKNAKTEERPPTVVGLIKLVQSFKEAGSLDDRVRSGRLSLRIISKRCKFTWLLILHV